MTPSVVFVVRAQHHAPPPQSLDDPVISSLTQDAFRSVWKRITTKAGIPGTRAKDLRDTFASMLLTAGVSIQWVSKQLGHTSIGTTETHYAEYRGAGGHDFAYVEPLKFREGEVPADLLSRLDDCAQTVHSAAPVALPSSLNPLDAEANLGRPWGARSPDPRIKRRVRTVHHRPYLF
jgi:hypothetical protein